MSEGLVEPAELERIRSQLVEVLGFHEREARHTGQLRALLEQLEPAFDVPLPVLDATEAAERHCLAYAEPKRPIASEALLISERPRSMSPSKQIWCPDD